MNSTDQTPWAWHLLPLTADTEEALEQTSQRLLAQLEAEPTLDLADVSATLIQDLEGKRFRRVLVCSDVADAIEVLKGEDEKRRPKAEVEGEASVAFLCSGQGAQYPTMGLQVYEVMPVFRAEVDRCCEGLEEHLGFDLRRLLFPAADVVAEEVAQELNQTKNTQPALFVIEYAMARQWMAWGVQPTAMIGHSIGEYAAACLAGVLSLQDALRLVATRGRLMQSLPSGAMLSVPMRESDLEPFLNDQLSVAAANGPRRLVVSGPHEAVEDLKARLAEKRKPCQFLHTSHAFHSVMMEPILEPFIAEVGKVSLSAPKIPYVSNFTGEWITDEEATDPTYYAKHLRHAVRYSDGVSKLFEEPRRVSIEVGPGRTLISLAQRHPARQKTQPLLGSIRHPKDTDIHDLSLILETIGRVWLAGGKIDWSAMHDPSGKALTNSLS